MHPVPPPAPPAPPAPQPPAVAPEAPDGHVARLRELLRLETAETHAAGRRRGRRPTDRQRLQQRVRREAVACWHSLQAEGQTREQVARLLHLAPRTLRFWEQGCRLETVSLFAVGRPPERSPRPVRQEILAYLRLTGPGVGVPTLREHFPDLGRAELADLLGRYRAVCRARGRTCPRLLHWQTPGRVWAADFTEPSRYGGPGLPPVAGLYPYVLAVRDLASGAMLAWQPIPELTAEVAGAALARLFALHGAPLVLKTDNGSAFRADPFRDLLAEAGVVPLYSPAACPSYNGAIEAAIGSLKRRTEDEARARGDGGRWLPADLAAALLAANAGHPRRLNGRTPASVWEQRQRIDPAERVGFALTVRGQRDRARDELGIAPEEELDHWHGSAVDRLAVERALVEHGHLLFTRRRIPLQIRPGKVATDG